MSVCPIASENNFDHLVKQNHAIGDENLRDDTENKWRNEHTQQKAKRKQKKKTTKGHESHMQVLEKAEGYRSCLVDLSTRELQNSQQIFYGMRTDRGRSILNYKMFYPVQ